MPAACAGPAKAIRATTHNKTNPRYMGRNLLGGSEKGRPLMQGRPIIVDGNPGQSREFAEGVAGGGQRWSYPSAARSAFSPRAMSASWLTRFFLASAAH